MNDTLTQTITVTLTYCNNIEFTHKHETVKEATEEYAKMLAEAIEPVGELSEALHVRKVTMQIDRDGEITHFVHSGVFECSHSA